jgi:hypothetical protein
MLRRRGTSIKPIPYDFVLKTRWYLELINVKELTTLAQSSDMLEQDHSCLVRQVCAGVS